MAEDLSFKEVRRLLEQHEPKLLEKVDILLGPAIVLTGLAGVAVGLPGTIALAGGLLGPKNVLTAAGKSLLQYLAAKKYGGSLDRFQRMQIAYCLLSFTAFFDTIDDVFPSISKSFGLSRNEKLSLSKSAFDYDNSQAGQSDLMEIVPPSNVSKKYRGQLSLETATGILEQEIPLPHPAEGEETREAQLRRLYEELARGYLTFLKGLSAYEEADDKSQEAIRVQVGKLPDLSITRHRAQYVDLARQFPEFFVWATLYEHAEHREHINKLSSYWKRHVELSRATEKRIDLGFSELGQAISALPAAIVSHRSVTVIEELLRRYVAYIEKPVIEEDFPVPPGAEPLRFPKRSEAFVPQAFRVLRSTGRERLEDERTWQNLNVRQDLGSFILSYFSSPYSFRYPLLILGDPGSGKSLLTHMLAARLICPQFTPIRVELRALEADEVAQQIEEQIARDTNGQKASWPLLNAQLQEAPALVLLDGYDELLQASGKVYAGYLQSVRQFQDTERTLGHPPVRAVVTSRITLIDKTRMPAGTTVIRLEPFDKPRREKWIEVWNQTNAEYFKRSNPSILPFGLPEDDGQVAELAEQPLLLLMLAIYDSYANELREKKGLDRTRLYENLLRRFIERELSKNPSFGDLESGEQGRRVDAELERLGIIAISMFNRRSLLIKSEELEMDLKFFDCERGREVPEGRTLRQSDLLLGSFFFVHESRSASKGKSSGEADIESAFQFLHNTFGEFLAARFLVERVFEQANRIYHIRQSPVLSAELDRRLVDPAGLGQGWIASLIFTPLFSRPVVVGMIREWLPHRLKGKLDSDAFLLAFDTIIDAELRRLLERGQLPALMMISPGYTSFKSLPLLGHMAIYSNNIVVLRTTIPDGRFSFKESGYVTYEDGVRPWDRLAHMWRSWFALDSLHGLTAILSTERDGDEVHLEVRDRFTTPSPRNRLEAVRDVGRVLGDGVVAGLSAFESLDPSSFAAEELGRIRQELGRERIDLEIELITYQMRARSSVSAGKEDLAYFAERCRMIVERVGAERPGKVVEMFRALWEQLMLYPWNSDLDEIRDSLFRSLLGGPFDLVVTMAELLADTGTLALDRRLVEELFERSFRPELSRPGLPVARKIARMLSLAVRVGHWSLARHIAEDLIFDQQSSSGGLRKKGKSPNNFDHLDKVLEHSPDLLLDLLRVALINPESDRWPASVVRELWVRSLEFNTFSRLPVAAAIKVIRLLPQAVDVEFAQRWIEHFFLGIRKGRFKRRLGYGVRPLILAGAEVASQVKSLELAKSLVNEMVKIHPREVIMPYYSSYSDSMYQNMPLALLEAPLKLVRLAEDKKQARAWLVEALDMFLLPAIIDATSMPIGVRVELAHSLADLQVDFAKSFAKSRVELREFLDLGNTARILREVAGQLEMIVTAEESNY